MKTIIRNAFTAAVMLAALLVSPACQREAIVYPTSDYYLAVTVEPDPLQKEFVNPSIYVANFYDAATGRLSYSTFIRTEGHPEGLPAGGFVTGVTPGDYDLIVYNFDTRTTTVEEAASRDRIYAYAEIAGRSSDVPVTFVPDPLYTYCERISVPYVAEGDGVHVIRATLRPALETWTVVVDGVRNASLAETVIFYLSGQAMGRYLGDGSHVRQRSIVMASGHVDAAEPAADAQDSLVIVGDYLTFGYLDGVDRVLLTMQITGPNGSLYTAQEDVTAQMLDPGNDGHVIRVTFDIEVKEREDGGFTPKAEPWTPDVTTIILE